MRPADTLRPADTFHPVDTMCPTGILRPADLPFAHVFLVEAVIVQICALHGAGSQLAEEAEHAAPVLALFGLP